MKEFLSRYMPQKKGDVLSENGEIIGTHNGALFFTIGERHGFTITKKSNKNVPLYVISKNIKNNTITVAPKNTDDQQESSVKKIWLSLQERPEDFLKRIFPAGYDSKTNLSCRIRYRGEKIKCKMIDNQIILDKPQMGVSAGQSLVLYDGEICLGGGIIDS
jgi:tRNA-specific 2-thiouridylase